MQPKLSADPEHWDDRLDSPFEWTTSAAGSPSYRYSASFSHDGFPFPTTHRLSLSHWSSSSESSSASSSAASSTADLALAPPEREFAPPSSASVGLGGPPSSPNPNRTKHAGSTPGAAPPFPLVSSRSARKPRPSALNVRLPVAASPSDDSADEGDEDEFDEPETPRQKANDEGWRAFVRASIKVTPPPPKPRRGFAAGLALSSASAGAATTGIGASEERRS